jgi:2,4-dienoyl-CoA reductase-like NADH-dependent reductase (Old Yellow Enzyme family)
MSSLYQPLALRAVTLRNRIGISPMCQYSSVDGFANDWHLVHLGSRAVGGSGFVCAEASAVESRGRITLGDLGIWDDRHVDYLARIAQFISRQGAVPAIQLAHAGRKASAHIPWQGGKPLSAGEGAWTCIGPSALAFADGWPIPCAATLTDVAEITAAFASAAERARAAGFKVIEIHAAHGYLLHSFLSPLANQRTDQYGGSFDNRLRFLLEVVRAVRQRWPDNFPLFVRLSCTDWIVGGWDLAASIELAKHLAKEGVDLIDCSSGGILPSVQIPVGASYQVPFAEEIRRAARIATAAVGMITQFMQAEDIIHNGRADLVLMARESLRDPYFPLRHAMKSATNPPTQYGRAFA